MARRSIRDRANVHLDAEIKRRLVSGFDYVSTSITDAIFACKYRGRAHIERHKQYTYPIIDVLRASCGRRLGHTCSTYTYLYVHTIE